MENKIKRYLELSVEFTIKSHEIYEGFTQSVLTASGHNNFVVGYSDTSTINSACSTLKFLTKLEHFEKSQLEKIEKAKRYEEYLELQKDLLGYYNAKEKLK